MLQLCLLTASDQRVGSNVQRGLLLRIKEAELRDDLQRRSELAPRAQQAHFARAADGAGLMQLHPGERVLGICMMAGLHMKIEERARGVLVTWVKIERLLQEYASWILITLAEAQI